MFVHHTPSSPSDVVAPCKTVPDVSAHFLSSSAVGPERDTEEPAQHHVFIYNSTKLSMAFKRGRGAAHDEDLIYDGNWPYTTERQKHGTE